MRGSWKVGELFGIGVFIHWSFWLIVLWVAMSFMSGGGGLLAALAGAGFVFALFGCVVLHELGHALTARQFGIGTRDITLLPIGGVARLERMPDDPKQEFLVAIAGPAVNVVIALVLFAVLNFKVSIQNMLQIDPSGGILLEQLMVVNVFLVLFNLLPAFPMDGGRILRSLLAMVMPYLQATRIAAVIGQIMAGLFVLVGLFGIPGYFEGTHLILALIGVFIFMGARAEAQMTEVRARIHDVPVGKVMATQFYTLTADLPVAGVAQQLMLSSQRDFPVLDGDHLVGMLAREDIEKALSTEGGPSATVGQLMQRDYPTAELTDTLERTFTRMQSEECDALPVLSGGRLVGLLTLENIQRWLQWNALSARQRAASGGGPAA